MGKRLTLDRKMTEREGVKVFVTHSGGIVSRRYIETKDNGIVPYSRYVWMKYYPDNPIQQGEEIHHINFDSFNDAINNLRKMTHAEHEALHKKRKAATEARRRKRQRKEKSGRVGNRYGN